MSYVLAVALLAAVGLCALLAVGLISFAKAALTRADRVGVLVGAVEEQKGDAKVNARKVEDANTATTTALASEKKQTERGDRLEKDLVDEEARPHGGLAGLSELTSADETVPDRGAGTGASGSQR